VGEWNIVFGGTPCDRYRKLLVKPKFFSELAPPVDDLSERLAAPWSPNDCGGEMVERPPRGPTDFFL
jgi:hypothetical protein